MPELGPNEYVQVALSMPEADRSVVLGDILWHSVDVRLIPGGRYAFAAVFVTRTRDALVSLKSGDVCRLIVLTPGAGVRTRLFRVWPVRAVPGDPSCYPGRARKGCGVLECVPVGLGLEGVFLG